MVFTAAGHSVCSGGIMVTGSWLSILLKKFEGMCCPYKKTEPILSKGKGRNEFLKKSSFMVMYDREGADGLIALSFDCSICPLGATTDVKVSKMPSH